MDQDQIYINNISEMQSNTSNSESVKSVFENKFDPEIMDTIKTNLWVAGIFVIIILSIRFIIPPKEGATQLDSQPMLLWKKLTLKSETVFKPLIDQRQYKFITLENGIEALLV